MESKEKLLKSIDKWNELSQLNEGSKVKLISGEIAIFNRLKRKNFVGIIDNKSYNIPVDMFETVLEKSEKKINEKYKSLKKGDLFFISHNNQLLLFKFDKIKNNKIYGINPINKSVTTIDISLFKGKINGTLEC